MKICPFCAEEIQNEALKCKHCGEWLQKTNQSPASSHSSLTPKKKVKEKSTSNDNAPIICGKFELHPSYFIYKNKKFPLIEIKHIDYIAINHGVWYYGTTANIGEQQSVSIGMSNGRKILIRSSSGIIFGKNKGFALSRIIDALYVSTFQQRASNYIEDINTRGYLLYDKTKFYPNGTIVTRKSKKISLEDYSICYEPGFMKLQKNNVSTMNSIGKRLISGFPNRKLYEGLLHGELVVKTNLDTDVFKTLIDHLYLKQ